MTGQRDEDIPETGAIFTFGKSGFADNVPCKFWVRNDQPGQVSCGGEHTAVITENGRLLVFGDNTWGQLGLGLKPAARKPASVKARTHTASCGCNGVLLPPQLPFLFSDSLSQCVGGRTGRTMAVFSFRHYSS